MINCTICTKILKPGTRALVKMQKDWTKIAQCVERDELKGIKEVQKIYQQEKEWLFHQHI